MDICKETKWLCENAKSLEKYSGQWVVFSATRGLVGKASTLNNALRSFRHAKSSQPFLFHVPSKEELVSPLPVASKK